MATYYVDSNATGLNDGSSWTDAWASITSSTGVSGGDTILVASNHSEVVNAYLSYGFSGLVKIISTSTSTNLYQRGATLTQANFDGIAQKEIFGFDIITNNVFYFDWVNHGVSYFEDCDFTINHIVRFTSKRLTFKSCNWDQSAGNVKHEFWEDVVLTFDNCVISTNASQGRWVYARSHLANVKLRSCEIGTISIFVENSGGANVKLSIENCNNSIVDTYLGNFSQGGVKISNSQAGTISSPVIQSSFKDGNVESSTSLAEYRSNGANNGTQGYSFKLESGSSTSVTGLDSFPISSYVQSTSQTITVYIAGGSSLNNDDFWIEVESPSELVSPTAQGKFRTTKPDPLVTPTALTSDTSTWTGTGVGTVQKIEVPISPTVAGTVTVRCYLAKPSTTVYVDPKLSNTGYQRVYNGVLVDDNETIITTTTSTAGTQIYPFRQFVSDKFGAVLHPLRSN
jgi:hypothetical protein